ncbi:MAG: DUF1501 domain-containing protein [Zavarzinella sp.]
MLAKTGTGLGMLGLASVLADEAQAGTNPLAEKRTHFPARAKHVIHLFMNGGPSQVDTFDPKPELEKYHGKKPPASDKKTERRTGGLMKSPYQFKKSGKSGLPISDIYPNLAKYCADDLCVIRSMHTDVPNHEPSLLMMTSGNTQPLRPSMGSWLLYGLGSENQNLPGFVVLCPGSPVVGPALWGNRFLPGIYQGCHINNSRLDPKNIIRHIQNGQLGEQTQRDQLDLLQQLNQMHLESNDRDPKLEARIQSLEIAFRMQTSAVEAFDINKEPANVRDLYGKGQFADACMVASRLVERGVRMVQIYHGGGQPWDSHGDLEKSHRNLASQSDMAIAGLIRDLKRKGMLEDTLILWGGEFGRTPTTEGKDGRDHNNHGFSVWLAGGGVRGGMAYGATDEFGFAAVENKVHVHDLHATILHLMGLDHTKLTYRYSGRDFRLTDVHGEVVKAIIA